MAFSRQKKRTNKLLCKKKVVLTLRNKTRQQQQQQQQVSFTSILKNVTSILLPGGTDESNQNSLQQLIEQARQSCDAKGDVRDVSSLVEMVNVMNRHRQELDDTLERTFGHLDFSRLFPTSMYYYMELEDEIKNPSWKRRMHRFHSGVDIDQVQDLVSALYLAELSYASSVEEIQQGLQYTKHPVELVYCDTESTPKEPAHYILLKKEQSRWSNDSGSHHGSTRNADRVGCLDGCLFGSYRLSWWQGPSRYLRKWSISRETPYGIAGNLVSIGQQAQSQTHLDWTFVGCRSCSIAAMEWNDHPMMKAKVIGFGCPSLIVSRPCRTNTIVHYYGSCRCRHDSSHECSHHCQQTVGYYGIQLDSQSGT